MVKKKSKIKDEGLKELELLGEILSADEILERPIKPFGGSAHIAVPSKHIGKHAKIIIHKKTEGDTKQ